MRSFNSGTGPFGERVHYSLEEIDRICIDALRQAGCLPDTPSPVRIDRFIEKHFQCDIGYEDFEAGILGCTVFGPTGKVLRVSISKDFDNGTRPGERRLRSTLAHEAGHGLLHAHLFIETLHTQGRFGFDAKQQRRDRILCRANDIGGAEAKRTYDGKWWEFQANRAIGGLLLPKKLVELAARQRLGEETQSVTSVPRYRRDDVAAHISNVFDVNPIVARIRVAEMWPEAVGAPLL